MNSDIDQPSSSRAAAAAAVDEDDVSGPDGSSRNEDRASYPSSCPHVRRLRRILLYPPAAVQVVPPPPSSFQSSSLPPSAARRRRGDDRQHRRRRDPALLLPPSKMIGAFPLFLLPLLLGTALLLLLPATTSAAEGFDPYMLDGGLVCAVAGMDYVVVASDTRLTDGGYGLRSRKYLSGRVWCASSSSKGASGSLWGADGSLLLPPTTMIAHPTIDATAGSDNIIVAQRPQSQRSRRHLPVVVCSAGCASDCESLKRRVRVEVDAVEESSFPSFFSSSSLFAPSSASGLVGVRSAANLLQQVLYGRRGFPYYSFCVLAGIDWEDDGNEHGEGFGRSRGRGGAGTGAVYVYDAIGSYERVAAGCAGTGRDMLQPILDRLFAEEGQSRTTTMTTPSLATSDPPPPLATRRDDADAMRRPQLARNTGGGAGAANVPAALQRRGPSGSLRPPVQTVVSCSWTETVDRIVRAYRSASEREISTGDDLVVCVIKGGNRREGRGGAMRDGGGDGEEESEVEVFRFALKKH